MYNLLLIFIKKNIIILLFYGIEPKFITYKITNIKLLVHVVTTVGLQHKVE